MDMKLNGKKAIVSGAANGIGEATVLALLSEGAVVAGLDIDRKGLDELATSSKNLPGKLHTWKVDFTDADQITNTLDSCLEVLDGIDLLINNVGSGAVRTFEQLTDTDWQKTIDLNFMSYVRTIRHVLPSLRRSDSGVIINNASDLARQPEALPVDYSTTKAAILALTKALARAEGPTIRVNAVAPGPIWSKFWTKPGGFADTYADLYQMDPKAAVEHEMKQRQLPLGRLGTPEEVANIIVFLCSDASSFVTGSLWGVDGGSVRGLI